MFASARRPLNYRMHIDSSRENTSVDRLQNPLQARFFSDGIREAAIHDDSGERRRNFTLRPPLRIRVASPSPPLPRLFTMTLSDRFDQMEAKRVIVKPGTIIIDTTRSAKA